MRPITKKQYGESFKSWKIMYTHAGGIIDTIPSGGKEIFHCQDIGLQNYYIVRLKVLVACPFSPFAPVDPRVNFFQLLPNLIICFDAMIISNRAYRIVVYCTT